MGEKNLELLKCLRVGYKCVCVSSCIRPRNLALAKFHSTLYFLVLWPVIGDGSFVGVYVIAKNSNQCRQQALSVFTLPVSLPIPTDTQRNSCSITSKIIELLGCQD